MQNICQSKVSKYKHPIMSFHHVLTSNVAPETFPNNCASHFSTPVYNPYDFQGSWEVALTKMTHSNCVYTFYGERFTVEDSFLSKDVLERLNSHIKINLVFPKESITRKEYFTRLVEQVSNHVLLKHILQIEIRKNRLFWKIIYPEIFIILSRDLQTASHLYSTVLTAEDRWPATALYVEEYVTIKDASIIIGKKSVDAEHYQLKPENAEMTLHDLIKVFNNKMPATVTSMLYYDKAKTQIAIRKLKSDGIVLFLNNALNEMLNLFHAAYEHPDVIPFSSSLRPKTYSLPWVVSLIRLKPKFFTTSTSIYHLANKQFTTRNEACNYLNSFDNRVTFSCDEQNITSMKISSTSVNVKFDNDLRDILAFDKNEYRGGTSYTASNTLSLTRRIHYMYVYSNINKLVRIGDTQAPLLAILPFDSSKCVPHIERQFKYPMYISLARSRIAQMDIEIRDDAGQLIPFVEDALTTIRLHFRQIYANA